MFPIKNRVINCLIIGMGSICMGLPISYCSVTLPQMTEYFKFDTTQSIWFNSSGIFCAAVGAVLMGFIVSKIGLRWGAFILGLISGLTFIGLGATKALWLAFLCRCLSGMTIGFCSSVTPVFFSSVAPDGKQGLFGFISQSFICIGFLLPTLWDFFADWRLNYYLNSIFGWILIVTIFLIPEPPKTEEVQSAPFLDLFKEWKGLLIGIVLMLFLQFSGFVAIVSNMKTIIVNSKLSIDATILNLIANLVQILATVVAAFVIDKLGKRIVWVVSASMQLVAFFLLFIHQQFNLHGSLFIIGLLLEQFGYGIGVGPIPFMHVASCFPDNVRSHGVGFLTALNWIFMAVVNLIWPYMEAGMGIAYSFLFYACVFVLSIIFGIFAFTQEKVAEVAGDDQSEKSSSSSSSNPSKAGAEP